jgi:hypothetical protein
MSHQVHIEAHGGVYIDLPTARVAQLRARGYDARPVGLAWQGTRVHFLRRCDAHAFAALEERELA